MLILTRRIGETLLIGDGIEVTILGIKGHQVRIGINAPRNVSVFREELLTGKLSQQAISRQMRCKEKERYLPWQGK